MSAVATLQGIEARLRAVDAVGDVVRAVWAIAQAQHPRAEAAVAEASAYLDWVDAIVERVAGRPLRGRDGTDDPAALTLAVGPERAFCGALARECADALPAAGRLGLVGRRFADAVTARPALRARVVFTLPGPGSVDEFEPVAEAAAAAVLHHAGPHAVWVQHPRDGRVAGERALLLPAPGAAGPGRLPDHFSPPDTLLADAARERATGRLVSALAEALRAEVRARVAATEHARHAIDERRGGLERSLRVLRQEGITAELLELFAGVDAA